MENLYSKVNSNDNIHIDADRICGHFSDMVHDITCQICLNIVYPDPVCCGICSQMFCKKCINNWIRNKNRCPNAHDYKEAQVNRLAKNLLENILLTCPNSNSGCTNQIKYGNYLKHVDTDCDYIDYTCHGCKLVDKKKIVAMHINVCELVDEKCGFCSSMFKRKDLSNHVKNCDERTIECGYCDKVFKNIEYNNHEMNCDEKMITCDNCKMKFKRKSESGHTKDICFKELMKYFENEESQNEKILKEKDSLISKLESEKISLQDQVVLLKNENATLSTKNQKLDNDNDCLIEKVDKLKKGIEIWKAHADKLEKELRNMNVRPLGNGNYAGPSTNYIFGPNYSSNLGGTSNRFPK
jgi:hypothetical protein